MGRGDEGVGNGLGEGMAQLSVPPSLSPSEHLTEQGFPPRPAQRHEELLGLYLCHVDPLRSGNKKY